MKSLILTSSEGKRVTTFPGTYAFIEDTTGPMNRKPDGDQMAEAIDQEFAGKFHKISAYYYERKYGSDPSSQFTIYLEKSVFSSMTILKNIFETSVQKPSSLITYAGTKKVSSYRSYLGHSTSEDVPVTLSVFQTPEQIESALSSGIKDLHKGGVAYEAWSKAALATRQLECEAFMATIRTQLNGYINPPSDSGFKGLMKRITSRGTDSALNLAPSN